MGGLVRVTDYETTRKKTERTEAIRSGAASLQTAGVIRRGIRPPGRGPFLWPVTGASLDFELSSTPRPHTAPGVAHRTHSTSRGAGGDRESYQVAQRIPVRGELFVRYGRGKPAPHLFFGQGAQPR